MEAITAQCAKHHFDRAVAVCGQCGLTFCPACLVYAFGPDKPPFCIPCALTAGGVRRAVNVPKVSWREKRARKKLLDQQNAAVAEATLRQALANAMPEPEPEPPAAPEYEAVYEWSVPAAEATPEAQHETEPVSAAPSASESMPPLEIDWSAPFDPAEPFQRSSLAD